MPNTLYSNITPDPAALPHGYIDSAVYRGRIRSAAAIATYKPADIDAGAVGELCELPSNCVLLPTSKIHHGALTGCTDCDLGDANDPDGLVDGASYAIAADDKNALAAVSRANYGKRLWELLGYTEDPAKPIALRFTFNAAGTFVADVVVVALFQYVVE